MNFNELQARQQARIVRVGQVMGVVILLLIGASLARVAQLKVAPDERLVSYLEPPTSTRRELGRRGDIVDVRGRVLATSVVGYRVFLDPQRVENLETASQELAPRLGLHPQEIVQAVDDRLEDNPKSRYVVLDDELEDWQVDAIRQQPIKGVGLEPRLVRHYPHRDVAASIVGFVGTEHTGLAGAELRLNETLEPHGGRLTFQHDAAGRLLWIDDENFIPKRDGEDTRLSIDLVIQEMVEDRLEKAARQFNARGARAVIMDAQTGDILAIVDVLRNRRGFTEVIEGDDRDIHPSRGRNRCVTDPFEPGSTFKAFVWGAATDMRRARPDETLPLPHGIYTTSRGRSIRDVKSYGPVTWETVLIRSLNSGMAYVGERFTSKELREIVRKFGFGERTGCGLPGESAGLVTSAKNWTHHTQTSVPMGQEIAVTMVQMARAFSAFCRDGTMVEPRLVIPDDAIASDSTGAPIRRRVMSEAVALKTRDVMRTVMTVGTGRRAQSEQYQIFGKTGTPQLPIPKRLEKKYGRRGYFQDRYIATFVAGAPYVNPKIVVVVTIDDPDPKIAHYGGETAAPVARDIIDDALSYLGVEPDVDPDLAPAKPEVMAAR